MANRNLPYGDGVSIHRPHVFNGENYVYWKIMMRIFIEAIDIAVWDAIENGPYIPMTKDGDGKREKHWSEWSDDEKKRAQYNYRAKNIITSGLSTNEFIAWEDNDSSTTSDESEFEENNLCLMAGADQVTIVRDFDLESNPDYDQLQEAFIQIHKEVVKLNALNSKLKGKLLWYENALIRAEQELEILKNEHENLQTILNFNEAHCETSSSSKADCESCKLLEKENADLKNSLAKFTKINTNLNIILGKQRHVFDISGLGFNQIMNMPSKSKERVFKRNQSFRKFKGNFIKQTTCIYCCKKVHRIRNCYSKKYGVPNGEMIWIKKSQRLRTNHQGPFTWVPKECLRAKNLLWYLDSGCSRHMTGDPSKISSLKLKNEGFVTYGDNNKGKILGCGNIGNSSSSTMIENVLLVEGLKHNLLSISQLSDKGFKIEFDNTCCLICDKLKKEIRFIGKRIDNIYMLDLEYSITISNTKCLITKEDNIWIWHRRAAHIHMDHLNKLSRKELVIGLPKLKFSKNKLCDAYKNLISTSRPL
uniref:Uncharacterized protein n=1 Tax=Cajanus cajan TaxID=3821 RepID=A0A151UIC7_CAJCA